MINETTEISINQKDAQSTISSLQQGEEHWKDYFLREAAQHCDLGEDTVARMLDQLFSKDIGLQLSDVDATARNARLIKFVPSLIAEELKWSHVKKTLAKNTPPQQDTSDKSFAPSQSMPAVNSVNFSNDANRPVKQELNDHEFQQELSDHDFEQIMKQLQDEEPPSQTPQNKISNNILNRRGLPYEVSSSSTPPVEEYRAALPSAAEASKETAQFAYPKLPLDLTAFTHEGLKQRSIELATQFRCEKDYDSIREEFVRVSLALNQVKLLAPAYRDQPRMPYLKSRWEENAHLLIDQIVIDCHWLHCRGEQVNPRWPELKAMFASSGGFDCAAIARKIAAKDWSCDFRVLELFYLNNRQQAQLMQLRSNALKKKFQTLLEGTKELDSDGKTSRMKSKVSPVRMAINNWVDSNHRVRGQEEMYESIWVAIELLGPKAKSKEIADLAALRCGVRPLSPRTVIDKITILKKVLADAHV